MISNQLVRSTELTAAELGFGSFSRNLSDYRLCASVSLEACCNVVGQVKSSAAMFGSVPKIRPHGIPRPCAER